MPLYDARLKDGFNIAAPLAPVNVWPGAVMGVAGRQRRFPRYLRSPAGFPSFLKGLLQNSRKTCSLPQASSPDWVILAQVAPARS
jgi:hypothetical protein